MCWINRLGLCQETEVKYSKRSSAARVIMGFAGRTCKEKPNVTGTMLRYSTVRSKLEGNAWQMVGWYWATGRCRSKLRCAHSQLTHLKNGNCTVPFPGPDIHKPQGGENMGNMWDHVNLDLTWTVPI